MEVLARGTTWKLGDVSAWKGHRARCERSSEALGDDGEDVVRVADALDEVAEGGGGVTWNAGGWAGGAGGRRGGRPRRHLTAPTYRPDDREVAAGELERQRHERLRDEAADLGGCVDDAARGVQAGVGCVDARAGAAEDALGLEDGEPRQALEEIGETFAGKTNLQKLGGIGRALHVDCSPHIREEGGSVGENAEGAGKEWRSAWEGVCTGREGAG